MTATRPAPQPTPEPVPAYPPPHSSVEPQVPTDTVNERDAHQAVLPDDVEPTRVCPKCSTQNATGGRFCPNCGASYLRRTLSRRTKFSIIGSLVVLVLAAGATVLVLARHAHDKNVAADKRAADASSSRAAAAARSSANASRASARRSEANSVERTRREAVVDSLQTDITKDARHDANDGLLDGPIKKTECTPISGGSSDLLEDKTGQFSCIAVTKISGDGTERGYRFSATVNWTAASYTWHLGD